MNEPYDWKIEVRAGRSYELNRVHVNVIRTSESTGRKQQLTEDGWTKRKPGEMFRETLALGEPQARDLLSDLWSLRLRPDRFAHEGQVAALSDHLGDMRKIVSKQLEVDL